MLLIGSTVSSSLLQFTLAIHLMRIEYCCSYAVVVFDRIAVSFSVSRSQMAAWPMLLRGAPPSLVSPVLLGRIGHSGRTAT